MTTNRMLVMSVVLVAGLATHARGYAVGPAVGLAELGKTAALVVKATVVADAPVTDPWFEPLPGFAPRDAQLRIVSVLKGATKATTIHFHHYAHAPLPPNSGMSYEPQSYELAVGKTYVVFAAAGEHGTYRQLDKSETMKPDQGVIAAGDARPVRAKAIADAVFDELRLALASRRDDDAIAAIVQLDELSGGRGQNLADFARPASLALIAPLIASPSTPVATAAIAVFGLDSPYFVDADAPYWLAGIGKGTIAGLGPRKPPATPAADAAKAELDTVAVNGKVPAVRALAIRALARSHPGDARILAWWGDADLGIRAATVLATAERPDHSLIEQASTAAEPSLRHAAALAIGFSQDPGLVGRLDRLLDDGTPAVAEAAAMSLLAFAIGEARPVLTAKLHSDYRALFINALARTDARPYLAELAEVIEKQLEPKLWWGGAIPSSDSWAILFAYVASVPRAELGKLTASLDALEKMKWFGSSEPQKLYALYLRRGMVPRAKAFRAAIKKSSPYDMDVYFDMVDKRPETYVP